MKIIATCGDQYNPKFIVEASEQELGSIVGDKYKKGFAVGMSIRVSSIFNRFHSISETRLGATADTLEALARLLRPLQNEITPPANEIIDVPSLKETT